MPAVQSGTLAVILLALVVVLVLLLVVFLGTSFLVMRRRRLLCFKRDRASKPFLLTDRELEKRHGGWKRNSKFPQRRKRKKNRGKKINYQSLSRPPKFPTSDPFRRGSLENPLVHPDDFDMDWTNPAFDEQGAQIRDAALTIQSWCRMIRVRIPYLELKESTIIVQSLYRGRKARAMLPQRRKEKAAVLQARKKQAGWKKQGTLTALKYYDIKAFGFAEVEQLYGMETVRNAAQHLKDLYGGKGKMRLKLFISIKGIKLYHHHNMEHFATVSVATVSFCTLDPKNRKIFAFINRKKRRNFCHVFQASESDAQKMVETMAQAFEVMFRKTEKKKVKQERERQSRSKKALFDRESQQLDDEVQSMLDMAESASSTIRLSDFSENGSSYRGSQEKLITQSPKLQPHRSRKLVPSSASGLTVSHKATSKPKVEEEEEQQRDYTAVTIEKEHRRTRMHNRQMNDALVDNRQMDDALVDNRQMDDALVDNRQMDDALVDNRHRRMSGDHVMSMVDRFST